MSKITESARGENCQIRIPGVCNHDRETVVFCHDNGGSWALKKPDSEGAYGCSACHDAVDGRAKTENDRRDLRLNFLEAQQRTRAILIEKGLLILK